MTKTTEAVVEVIDKPRSYKPMPPPISTTYSQLRKLQISNIADQVFEAMLANPPEGLSAEDQAHWKRLVQYAWDGHPKHLGYNGLGDVMLCDCCKEPALFRFEGTRADRGNPVLEVGDFCAKHVPRITDYMKATCALIISAQKMPEVVRRDLDPEAIETVELSDE